MRSFRWLALWCATLLPAVASAQTDRGFQNSWFWGVKGGLASFSTETVNNATAPTVGAEWLITRKRFGLYVAGDYAFFNARTTVPGLTVSREEVSLHNLRRVTVAGLVFPKSYGAIRPYAGLGLSANFISRAQPTRSFSSSETDEQSFVSAEVADARDRTSFLLMGGVQGQLGSSVPFAQLTWQPSQVNFLLSGRPLYLLDIGIRLNLGTSIEQP
jgi:hypothetical protein